MPYRDFERFFEEPEPIRFSIRGEDFKVEANIPASALLAIRGLRMPANADERDASQMTGVVDRLFNLMEKIMGKSNFARLMSIGDAEEDERRPVSFQELQGIFQYVMENAMNAIGGDGGEEGGPGNVTPTPNQLASTSSPNTGDPYNQTSTGITMSGPES